MVAMDGEKMSKSKGNLAFVRDLIPKYGGDALRLYLLSEPYRQPFEYFERDLAAAAADWTTIAAAADGPTDESPTPAGEATEHRVIAALDEDLNTPLALDAVRTLAADIQRSNHAGDRTALRSVLSTIGFRIAAPA
jgi:cysteinyl-tRNA synthetase